MDQNENEEYYEEKEEIDDKKGEDFKSIFFKTRNNNIIKVLEFLNIYDLFKLKSLNSNLNSILNDLDIYKKYLKFRRSDLITYEEKEEVITFNKKLKQIKSPLNNLYINNNLNREKKIEIKEKLNKNKINLRSFFFNDGEKLKKLKKKHNLTSQEEKYIFYGLSEYLILEEINKNFQLILNNCNINNTSNYLSNPFVNSNKCQLNTLILTNNKFGEKISNMKKISQIIENNVETLEIINLSNNNLNDSSIKIFFNCIKDSIVIKHLNLSFNKFSSEGIFFSGKFFKKNNSLKTLKLNNNLLGSKGILFLSNFFDENIDINIEEIDLSFNAIQKDGAKFLCKMLVNFNKLKNLNIGGNLIEDEGIENIFNFYQNFYYENEEEDLNENKEIRNEDEDENENENNENNKKNNKTILNLEKIYLHNNNLTEKSIENLCEIIKNISYVNLKTNFLGNEIKKLFEKPDLNIRVLNLGNNNISFEGIYNISMFYNNNNNCSIEEIYFDDNKLNKESCVYFKEILENKNCNLKVLSLNNCNIKKNLFQIFQGLNKNKSLEKLFLDNNNLFDVDIKKLNENFKKNKNLKEITLNKNNLTSQSVINLKLFFSKFKMIEKVDLNDNNLKEIDAKIIEDEIRKIKENRNENEEENEEEEEKENEEKEEEEFKEGDEGEENKNISNNNINISNNKNVKNESFSNNNNENNNYDDNNDINNDNYNNNDDYNNNNNENNENNNEEKKDENDVYFDNEEKEESKVE